MTKEERSLLLQDLCGRLPYRTFVQSCHYNTGSLELLMPRLLEAFIKDEGLEIKPYLRPISSITEEEEFELNGLFQEVYDFSFRMDELLELIQIQRTIPFQYIDWLNAHHFDYRGLIEKGLALEAPEGMYNIK